MFFPKAMTEIELIVPSRDLLKVMKVLGGRGVFHQADSASGGVDQQKAAADGWQEKAATYATLERRIQALLQSLGIDASSVSARKFEDVVPPEDVAQALNGMETETRQVSDELAAARRDLEQLQSDRSALEPVADVDVSMEALRESHFLYPVLGTMPAANVSRMQTSLARVPHVFMVMRDDSERPVVWVAGSQSNKDILVRAARSAYLEVLKLPLEYEGTPREIIARLDSEVEKATSRIRGLEGKLADLAKRHQSRLLEVAWDVHASRTVAEAILRFGRLRHTYIIVGWVPSDDLNLLNERIRHTSSETLIETTPVKRSGDRHNVPVALQTSPFLRPFQMLVTTYARPRYGEIDPTWLIAITFPLLFGAMFGDVGHGLLLAVLGSLIASGKIRALKSLAGLGSLIAICGLVATIFGFLYGSLFGYEDVLPALWMHPLQNILSILIVAVGAGVVLLTIGFLIGIFNAWVSRDWGHFLFGHTGIAGFVLYWSLLGFGASLAKLVPVRPLFFGILAVVGGLAVMFSEVLIHLVDGERPLVEGGLATYAIQAPVELFEAVISLLSNSLSYVRVGAFAVAHGGLSSAIFILAKLAGPEFGLAYWAAVAVGNVFIVGFEGLIVGIQTMRLSYYELFSKFFAGGGIQYEPISLTSEQAERQG